MAASCLRLVALGPRPLSWCVALIRCSLWLAVGVAVVGAAVVAVAVVAGAAGSSEA